jgi:predicted Zn-dependent protease
MMYDDDPKQGIVDGQVFKHPDLKLTFTAPTGYSMSNGAQAVTISGSGGQAQFSGAAYNGNLTTYVDGIFKAVGGQTALDYGSVKTTQINGLNVGYSSANANTQSGAVTVTVYAYEFANNSAFHILSITPVGSGDIFSSLFQSVRRISATEVAAIKPRKISIVTVKAGDTVASLSERMAYSNFKTERFQTLNAIPAGASLVRGQKVKIVIYG